MNLRTLRAKLKGTFTTINFALVFYVLWVIAGNRTKKRSKYSLVFNSITKVLKCSNTSTL